ncbi:transposase mutator type, partial [mine drainage metagenome]
MAGDFEWAGGAREAGGDGPESDPGSAEDGASGDRVTLQVPQTRDGSFSPELFKRDPRSEQAFVLALMEMVVQGVSTRKVTEITESLCGASFAKSTVSALGAGLDPRVRAFNERRLTASDPFVRVDARVLTVREEDRVVSKAALMASG